MITLSLSIADKRLPSGGFAVGGGSPPPASVPDVDWEDPDETGTTKVWYDMSRQTGYTNGDFVSHIDDRTSFVNHADNVVGDSTRPNWVDNAFGTGLDGLQFDAVASNHDVLNLASNLSLTGAFVLFIVTKNPTGSTSILGNKTANDNFNIWGNGSTSSNMNLEFGAGGVVNSTPYPSVPGPLDTIVHAFSRNDANLLQMRLMLGVYHSASYTAAGSLETVGDSAGTPIGSQHVLGELVLFEEELTTGEIERVMLTLARKWNAIGSRAIDDFSQYAVEGPTTQTLNGGYGWDDFSARTQWNYGNMETGPKSDDDFESYTPASPTAATLDGGSLWPALSSWNYGGMETGPKSDDDFESYTPASPTAETLNAGSSWGASSAWNHGDMETGIKASDDLESYSLESPISSTLNAGTGFPSAWSFSDN